jgi:hypothetical protein
MRSPFFKSTDAGRGTHAAAGSETGSAAKRFVQSMTTDTTDALAPVTNRRHPP